MIERGTHYNPGQFRRTFVQEQGQLPGIVCELEQSDAIGVDLEMAQRVERREGGYQEWVHVLALIQIASNHLSVVIDPVRCRDLSPLASLMAGSVRKVFLGGGQDDALLARAGIPARTVVDVGEVALTLYGRREDGMAALARRIFGMSLDKTVRRTDWLVRPLNPALLTYAHRDAELTLLIYRWMREHYPIITLYHERAELNPPLPAGAPVWLQQLMNRPTGDILQVVAEHGLDAHKDADELARAIRSALLGGVAPRQINRLLRATADLGLSSLVPEIVPFARVPSALVRSASARAIGLLAEPEVGEPVLQALKGDSSEDVKRSADSALKDLKKVRSQIAVEEDSGEAEPSITEEARLALQELLGRMESKET